MLTAMGRQTDSTPTPIGRRRRPGPAACLALVLALATLPALAGGGAAAEREQASRAQADRAQADRASADRERGSREQQVRKRIDRLVRETLGDERRIVVDTPNLASRLGLAPCDRVEPFVPAGARLWGRTAIAIRCADDTRWNASLPVNVRVFGPALVASSTVLAGTPAAAGAFRLTEVDLTAQPGKPVDDPALLEGRVLGRAIASGQPLRASDLRVLQTVSPGDPVQIRLLGNGFEIGAEGVALSGAGDGQAVRVRTDTGKILSGTARGRTVEIRM